MICRQCLNIELTKDENWVYGSRCKVSGEPVRDTQKACEKDFIEKHNLGISKQNRNPFRNYGATGHEPKEYIPLKEG